MTTTTCGAPLPSPPLGQSARPGDTDETAGPDDTDGVELPPECASKQPGVSAAFDYTGGWHDEDLGFVDCVIDSVAVEADTIVTTLTCGAETAVLKTAVAIEGHRHGRPRRGAATYRQLLGS